MDDGHEIARDSISRRSVIKRIGAGAAIAWSAPVLQSLSAPAHAQYGGECTECAGDFCSGQTICGSSGPVGACACAQPVGSEGGGTCFCYEDDFCNNRTPCDDQSDCPAGQTCTHSCCDASIGTAVCFSPCGTNANANAKVTSGPRGSRS
jgi:hypothetical protein